MGGPLGHSSLLLVFKHGIAYMCAHFLAYMHLPAGMLESALHPGS